MSGFEVANAFVRILPDVTAFRAQLQRQVDLAVAQVKIPPLQATVVANTQASTAQAAANTEVAASATAAAASTETLAVATGTASAASVREASAALAVTRALETQRLAEEALTGAIARNAEASQIQALRARATIAGSALNVAQLRQSALLSSGLSQVGVAGEKAASGLASASTRASIAQGSLIGLTRISGISALGLTAYSAAAVAAGLAIKSVLSSAANFEQLMNTFGAVTGATTDEIQAVSQAAQDLGADLTLPAVSAGDALVALTELAKAGLSVTDSLAAAKGVLQLSSAASIDVASAAQLAATQLNAFQLAGDQATRVAELLADASIAAQGEITDFGAGFQQVGAVANQVGLSIEDTTALLTELGKAGLRGADGGTSLRTALLRLVPTTKQAAEFQNALGINLDKTKSIGDQIVPLIEQYRTALADLTPIQQQQALTQIFGQDAIRAASIIFGQSAGELRRLTKQFESTNAIEDLSQAKTKGLKGAFGNLQSQTETLSTKLGRLVTGPLANLITGLADTVSAAGKAVDALGDLKKAADQKFEFNIPFTDTSSNSLGDEIVKRLFTTGPGFIKLTKDTLNATIVDVIRDARNGAAAEKRIAELGQTGGLFGIDSLISGTPAGARQGREPGTPTPLTDKDITARLSAEAKRRRAAVEALAKAAKDKLKITLEIPDPLEQDVIDAQLKGSLQAELKADNAIIAFFNRRLKLIGEGTKKFLAVSGQLRDAQANRDSVQGEIDSNAKAATAAAKQAADEAAARAIEQTNVTIGNARLAADAAGNQGKAEQVLLVLLKKRVHDAKRNSQELLDARLALDAEQEKQRQALVARTKLQIDLQNSILDTKLAQAQATPQIADDKIILDKQIAAAERDKKANQKIADNEKLSATIRLNAALQVQDDARKILAIRQSIKNLTGSGGFLLNDLFKEAFNQLNEFGSNVSTSPITGGGARAAVAGGILAQKRGLTDAEKAQLNETATTNGLLKDILTAIGPPPTVTSRRSINEMTDQEAGRLTAMQQRQLGAVLHAR